MKLIKTLLGFSAIVLFICLILTENTFACAEFEPGWVSPGPKEKKNMTISEATKKLQKEYPDISIEEAWPLKCTDGSTDKSYCIKTKKGEVLGWIPVPYESNLSSGLLPVPNKGVYLKLRVEQMLKTPVNTLLELRKADKLFIDDAYQMETKYGVTFSRQGKYKSDKEKVSIAVYKLTKGLCYGPQIDISSDNVYVGLTNYVPFKSYYTLDLDLYKKGDLEKVLKDQYKQKLLKTMMEENAANCGAYNASLSANDNDSKNNDNDNEYGILTNLKTYQSNYNSLLQGI